MLGSKEAIKRAITEKEPIKVQLSTEASGGVGNVGILDSADNRINPATRENQETIISKLDVNLSTRASETTLSGIKTQTDKLRFDPDNNLYTRRAHIPEVTIDYSNTTPAASTEYTTAIADVSDCDHVWVFAKADQAIDVIVEGGFASDGSDFAPLSGYKILSADFQTNEWNNIRVSPKVFYLRVKLVTGSTAPSSIVAKVVKVY